MADQLITYSFAALALVVPIVYWRRQRREARKSAETLRSNLDAGIAEPVTLHPVIDPNRCIGAGSCLDACPEGEILGMVNGRAMLIEPNRCIGHGACKEACSVDAITLVFGTARRGVDIPTVKETFETNVPGIYIAGELGGMGLIRNAITQGRQAVEYIAANTRKDKSDTLDLIVVGAGPAGLAAALQAHKCGLSCLLLEQGDGYGGTILSYPRQKVVMTQPMEIPLYGKFKRREVYKEELVELWHELVSTHDVDMLTGVKVEAVLRENGHFLVSAGEHQFAAKQVLLAIGRRGTPRKLGVPGEDATKVAYRLTEPEQFTHKKILVVGGGDSAIEAALALSEQEGTEVTLSYRKEQFSRLKEANRRRIEDAILAGRVEALMGSQVEAIQPDRVRIATADGANEIPNDHVFIFIGGELPTAFLKNIGIEMETKFGAR